jgi:RHS repeat-associated protein
VEVSFIVICKCFSIILLLVFAALPRPLPVQSDMHVVSLPALTASWTTPAVGSSPAIPWAHLFQGLKFADVTGLAYVRNRDYSPTLGRFIERDPIGFEAGDNNWYRFVANGPAGKTDPSGLWAWDDDWIQMGAGGLLGFYGTGVAADGWSSNTNVAIHKDIHAQAAAAREKAWRGYREATNPVDAGANLLFGVGLNAVGEGFAHGGIGIAEVVFFGGLRGPGAAEPCAVEGAGRALGSLGSNPFAGKSAQEIVAIFKARGYVPRGRDPASGKGTFVNPASGRGYHIDAIHDPPKGPHVGVHRPRNLRDRMPPRDYPMGEP